MIVRRQYGTAASRHTPPHDWRSFGAFFAVLVALFTEVRFLLTICLLTGWLSLRYSWIASGRAAMAATCSR